MILLRIVFFDYANESIISFMTSNVRIEKLILNNYRNHSFIELEFKKNIILIAEKTALGKQHFGVNINI